MQTLRDYQTRALEQLRAGFAAGKRRQLLCAPTGSGKTTIASHIILGAIARGTRVVFIAHRKELVDQASARLDEHGVPHGVIMADHPRANPLAQVQVCSLQTLVRRRVTPEARLLIIDECAHAAAASYRKLSESYPAAFVVGLTATPWRLDGKGLAEHFDASVLAAEPRELIDQGHLVNYVGYKYMSPDLSDVKTRGGDYENAGLELACSKQQVVGDVVTEWMTHAAAKRTIVFGVNLKHARLLADSFIAAGVPAATVDYSMQKDVRESILARVTRGDIRVICNVNLLTEGWDFPALECAVLARPTKSLALYLQMVGRIMRPFPGKVVARIHDHAGLVDMHGLPDDARDYSLQATKASNLKQSAMAGLYTCKNCFAVMGRREHSTCPECGAPIEVAERANTVPQETDGIAVDIRTAAAARRDRNAWLNEMVALAIEKGFKPGWIVWQHGKQFPTAPKPWGAFRKIRDAQRKGFVVPDDARADQA